MARTFISQPTQVFSSELYDDTFVTGVNLQTTSSNLQDDLNAIRTQIRQVLWAGVSGSWYDPITAPSGTNSARGVNTINVDLTDLEQKRFLYRVQNLNVVTVAVGSNFALLSASQGTAPANFAAIGTTNATGSVVAYLSGTEGSYGAHSVAQVSGSSVITPKNLVVIRDASTGLSLSASNGRDIYGLLQVESGSLTGDAFNDTTHRTQISFVFEVVANQTSSLQPATAAAVGGHSIEYSYIRRTALDDIPEDAYMSDRIFTDFANEVSGNFAMYADITLQNAINNQVGTVTQNKNIAINLGAGFSWTFLSASKELWKLVSSDTTDTLTVAVDRIGFSSSFATTFQQGISVATGSTQIDVGVIAGTINTLSGNNLVLSGGAQLGFSDFFGPSSTYPTGIVPLAKSTIEWSNYFSYFGASSILGALKTLSQSLSGSASPKRIRTTAGVNTNVNANVNVTFPTNVDAQLGSYVGKSFITDLNVYYNGVLLLPGTSVSNANDVYPGTSAATGDLKFPYKIKSGSQLTLETF